VSCFDAGHLSADDFLLPFDGASRTMTRITQITSPEAFEQLSQDPQAVLIDVRTESEWMFVGIPEVPSGQALFLSWQTYPGMAVNDAFVERLTDALGGGEADRDRSLLFLCRSGGRSQAAAAAMADAGFTACSNVSDGFEGDIDGERKRGRMSGWKASGLPWVQS
jgi:rhodanese-related sulfurtransferase